MPSTLHELVKMIAKRDDISMNEAQILVDETQEAMEQAFYEGSLDEVESILADYLGLEPDYMMLFIN